MMYAIIIPGDPDVTKDLHGEIVYQDRSTYRVSRRLMRLFHQHGVTYAGRMCESHDNGVTWNRYYLSPRTD
jgi:hypothetical protein